MGPGSRRTYSYRYFLKLAAAVSTATQGPVLNSVREPVAEISFERELLPELSGRSDHATYAVPPGHWPG